MTDLQAAVGIVQLSKLDAMIVRRRLLAHRYHEVIASIPGLRAVTDPAYGTGNYQSFWVEVGTDYPLDREGLLAALAQAGVSARRGIMATHRQPPYRHLPADLPVTERLTDATLILPLYHTLEESDQARVCAVMADPTVTVRASEAPLKG